MRCQSCGFENRVGSAYCEQCRTALTRPCASCGDPVTASAQYCPACGAPTAGGPSRPSPAGGAPSRPYEAPTSGRPPRPRPYDAPTSYGAASTYGAPPRATPREARQGSGRDHFTGVVRDFQARREQWGNGGEEEIWHFRIERHDASGNALKLIPVEMRGLSFSGSVSNGDEVRLHGRWRDGTLRADELTNLTTHARVRAKAYRSLRVLAVVLAVLIGLFVIGMFVSVGISACTDTGGPPPGWPTEP